MADNKDTPSPPKAKSADAEENVRFLIACIKYAQNGKISFEDVAVEFDIVSKGAAAKRYERLLKAHGINPADVRAAAKASEPITPKKAAPKSKRTEENKGDEDEEDGTPGSTASPPKARQKRTPRSGSKKSGAKTTSGKRKRTEEEEAEHEEENDEDKIKAEAEADEVEV